MKVELKKNFIASLFFGLRIVQKNDTRKHPVLNQPPFLFSACST